MLGLLPQYDHVVGRGHPQAMSASSSELETVDRHFTSGFRAYHRPSTFANIADYSDTTGNTITSSPFYPYRSPSTATPGNDSATTTHRVPSSCSSFMEPFDRYNGGVGPHQSMLYQQHYIDTNLTAQQQQQQHAMSPTFGVDCHTDQPLHRRLDEPPKLQQMTSSSVAAAASFFRQNAAAAVANTSVATVSAAGNGPLESTPPPPFDFYYQTGGDGSMHSYRGPLDAPYRVPPYHGAALPIFGPAADRVSAFGQTVSTTGVAPTFGYLPFQTNLQQPSPTTSRIANTTVSPDSGAIGSVRSSLSSPSSVGCLAIDETPTLSSPRSGCLDPTSNGRDVTASLQQHQKTRGRRAAVAVPPDRKDTTYYERRKKNNESARRSRESRHTKEQMTLDECQAVRDRNTKMRIQIELLHRDYNDMCRIAYGRIGPAAASRLIVPPPPPPLSTGYGYLSASSSSVSNSDGPGSYLTRAHGETPSTSSYGVGIDEKLGARKLCV